MQLTLHLSQRLLEEANVPSEQVVSQVFPKTAKYLLPEQERQLVAAEPLQV